MSNPTPITDAIPPGKPNPLWRYLVAHFPMDEASGPPINAHVLQEGPLSSPGHPNFVVSDGEYILTAEDLPENGTDDFTMAMWFYPPD